MVVVAHTTPSIYEKSNFSHFSWPCISAFPQVRTFKFRKLIKYKLVDRFLGRNVLKLCIIAESSNFEDRYFR